MEEDVLVCPYMRCTSFAPFPDVFVLPCAKHGTVMVPYSEAPLRKHVYRYLVQKIFRVKYVTHRIVKR